MSPNPVTSAKSSTLTTSSSPPKRVIRDEIFTRFEKPFGFEHHTFNLWMMFIIPSAFSLYAISQYLTFQYPFRALIFWSKSKIYSIHKYKHYAVNAICNYLSQRRCTLWNTRRSWRNLRLSSILVYFTNISIYCFKLYNKIIM